MNNSEKICKMSIDESNEGEFEATEVQVRFLTLRSSLSIYAKATFALVSPEFDTGGQP